LTQHLGGRVILTTSATKRATTIEDNMTTADQLNAKQFYRGGDGPLVPGVIAYFTTSVSMASFYGEVKRYRLNVKRPKFVTQSEWMSGLTSTTIRCDRSALERLASEGYDAAVLTSHTFNGDELTILALDGLAASTPNN